jgi:hypothetical protein
MNKKMKISEESLTVRLSTELKIAVERRAAHYGVNLSEIGRLALEMYLKSDATAEKMADKLQKRKAKKPVKASAR